MASIIYLFPDTNLFIQCRALEELDWSALPNSSEVRLIVSRPVQREIDYQKSRGNDRVGRRAGKAYQRFRSIATTGRECEVVREANPSVKLCLAGSGMPSSALADVLDYTQADDAIVGHVYEYRAQHPERDVRLLTHDSGAMMTARAHDVPFIPIPDSWLLDPEPSEAEKEIRRLTERIAELEAGPRVEIAFVDDEGKEIKEITATHQYYSPLTDAELDDLIELLDSSMPKTYIPRLMQGYSDWKERCRDILSDLHNELQIASGGVPFTVVAQNTGTKPAKDMLIQVSAPGHLAIRPYWEDDETTAAYVGARAALPSPPTLDFGLGSIASGLLDLRSRDGEHRRDPDVFYFREQRPWEPVPAYSLECEQWRHKTGPEYFVGEIFLGADGGDIRGALECVVHADNLPTPVRAAIPVRIAVEPLRALEQAREMIREAVQRHDPAQRR